MRGHRATLTQEFAQGATVDQLHGKEHTRAIVTLVKHINERWMGQPCRSSRFSLEPGAELIIVSKTIIKNFERHWSIETFINAPINRGHPATSDK